MTLFLILAMLGTIGVAALISAFALRYVSEARQRDDARAVLLREAAIAQPVTDHVSSFDQFAAEGANDAPAVDVMFGADARTPAAPAQRWIAPAVATIVVALVAVTVFARRGDAPPDVRQQTAGVAASANRAHSSVVLTSLSSTRDPGGTLTVSGTVANPPDAPSLDHLMVEVLGIAADGRIVTTMTTAIEVPVLAAGNTSRFDVAIPRSDDIARTRVTFRLPEGAVVAHRDGRAQKAGAS